MKVYLYFLLIAVCGMLFAKPWNEHGRLVVSNQNSHYLAYTDGTPFFWLGDTGWELFHRLKREEAQLYLRDRADKGFTVIQAVLLSEFDGLKIPNIYGDLPLMDGNPLKPDVSPGSDFQDPQQYDYWDHAEYILRLAEQLGLYVAVLPCWGEYVVPREGNNIFDTGEQAYHYGQFVGERYRSLPNIIWMLGGDRQPDERPGAIDLWRAMAEGITDGVDGLNNFDGQANYNVTLMTHHAYSSSSNWFHNDSWIDFHAWGSYHADFYNARAYTEAAKDWQLSHPKPTLNSEPAYEEHILNWIKDNGYFTAFDVRQIAYWSVFAGACGHTYGAHPIWQFYDSTRASISLVKTYWQDALNYAGARQMIFLKKLMLSRPMLELLPDQTVITGGQQEGSGHICAIRGQHFAFLYIPTGAVVTIQMGKISGERVTASWYDPRTGNTVRIGEFDNSGTCTFDPPGLSEELAWLQTGRGCDWVLVLDDSAAGFKIPGQ
jgi:hypothetical protein